MDPSAGSAENASQRPSAEYATSPMTRTPVAMAIAPGGVGAGVEVGGLGLSPLDGGDVGGFVTIGPGVSPGPATGTTRTRPGSPSVGSEAIASRPSESASWMGASPTSIGCASPSLDGLGTQFRCDGGQTSLTSL